MARKRSSDFNVRQYMVERDFEIYYYSDVHFRSVGHHSHNYYEFYFFESGAVTMETAEKSFALRQGDLLVLPPGVSHRAVVTDDGQPYRRFVFWIGAEYLNNLTAQAAEYGYLTQRAARDGACLYHFDLLTFNSIRIRLFLLLDELHTQRYGRQERLRLEVRSLLLFLNRLVHEQRETRNPKDEKNKYALISAYIDEHLAEPLTVEKIAGEFYLSKSYVSHLFRESTGLSVYKYLTKKRLDAICAAVHSGTPIGESCLTYGFQDYSSFYRAFQKEYGMSPSSYRELHRL